MRSVRERRRRRSFRNRLRRCRRRTMRVRRARRTARRASRNLRSRAVPATHRVRREGRKRDRRRRRTPAATDLRRCRGARRPPESTRASRVARRCHNRVILACDCRAEFGPRSSRSWACRCGGSGDVSEMRSRIDDFESNARVGFVYALSVFGFDHDVSDVATVCERLESKRSDEPRRSPRPTSIRGRDVIGAFVIRSGVRPQMQATPFRPRRLRLGRMPSPKRIPSYCERR